MGGEGVKDYSGLKSSNPDVKPYLKALHKHFVVVTIDKAAKNFAFICKNYYVTKLLAEVSLSNSESKTYSKVIQYIEEMIQAIINYCKRFDLNITKLSNTKPLSNTISEIFKMIFNTVEIFNNKSFFYSGCKKFWVVQN